METEPRQAEGAAPCPDGCQARADFEQLRSQIPAAFLEITWPGIEVVYINSVARTLLGYADDDLVAGLSAVALIAPESRPGLLELVSRQLASTVAQGLPYRRQKGQQIHTFIGLRKDGTTFPAELQGAYILDHNDFPTGIRFVFWDITERVHLEEETRRLELLVRQSQKLDSLGYLAGGIAHDFNNLLTVVLGNIHLLRLQIRDDPAALELAHEAELAAERGADLIRRLLTFARPEVERSVTVDLARVVRETASLAAALLTSTTQIALDVSGAATTAGHATALQQVLMNLIINARDAMPAGGTISVTLESAQIESPGPWTTPDMAPGAYHVVTVTDTGAGIAPDIQERIFDPFFTTKGQGKGTGLGLAMALGIARAHGGWLSVESQPGRGSTFRLLVPALEAASQAA